MGLRTLYFMLFCIVYPCVYSDRAHSQYKLSIEKSCIIWIIWMLRSIFHKMYNNCLFFYLGNTNRKCVAYIWGRKNNEALLETWMRNYVCAWWPRFVCTTTTTAAKRMKNIAASFLAEQKCMQMFFTSSLTRSKQIPIYTIHDKLFFFFFSFS